MVMRKQIMMMLIAMTALTMVSATTPCTEEEEQNLKSAMFQVTMGQNGQACRKVAEPVVEPLLEYTKVLCKNHASCREFIKEEARILQQYSCSMKGKSIKQYGEENENACKQATPGSNSAPVRSVSWTFVAVVAGLAASVAF